MNATERASIFLKQNPRAGRARTIIRDLLAECERLKTELLVSEAYVNPLEGGDAHRHLEADCRVMADAVIKDHKKTDDELWEGIKPCTCPACEVAKKYIRESG